MPGSWQPNDLPNLTNDNWVCKSPKTDDYNCIGWAAGDEQNWWWPEYDGYWPNDDDRELTISAFIRAFGTRGYVECADGSLEAGYEKIALYAQTIDGVLVPAHAARQLGVGRWTSKLGPFEDIEHTTLESVICADYGTPVRYLRRPKPKVLASLYLIGLFGLACAVLLRGLADEQTH